MVVHIINELSDFLYFIDNIDIIENQTLFSVGNNFLLPQILLLWKQRE